MAETWKAVPGYDEMYEVSDHGRVRSWLRHRGFPGRRKEPRILRPGLNNIGYPRVHLYKNGRRERIFIHAIVLTTFVGPRSLGKECCHADGNRTNNHLSNLRWDTKSANTMDAIKHGTSAMPHPQGEEHYKAKLTEMDVLEIRRLYVHGDITHRGLAAKFGVDHTNIGSILRRETWAHVVPGVGA